jgi:NAD(P)-dependent dehydrogenase (short-subunit alcohol dehydrogenase family)
VSTVFIAGIDSAIGAQLATDLGNLNWKVFGSSRRDDSLTREGIFYCDFSSQNSVDLCIAQLQDQNVRTDLLVVSVGVLQPIGLLGKIDFNDWEDGFAINCINPLRFIHGMLSKSILSESGMILTFAGGGINSAPTNYSSYTVSKIALTKSMEILAAEYPNMKFVSLGTGWIKSPIHNQTLAAGISAGRNLDELNRRLIEDDFEPLESVSDFVVWAYGAGNNTTSGRNFSLATDPWGDERLVSELLADFNKYKLRRSGNG